MSWKLLLFLIPLLFDAVDHYTEVFTFIQFAGIVAAPVGGSILDRNKGTFYFNFKDVNSLNCYNFQTINANKSKRDPSPFSYPRLHSKWHCTSIVFKLHKQNVCESESKWHFKYFYFSTGKPNRKPYDDLSDCTLGFAITTVLAVCLGFCNIIPIHQAQYAVFIIHVCCRGVLYAVAFSSLAVM